MKKTITNTVIACLFMNFAAPEIIFQYEKFQLQDSLAEQIRNMDMNQYFNNHSTDILDANGTINEEQLPAINENQSIAKAIAAPIVTKQQAKLPPPIVLDNISLNRKKILEESKKHLGTPYRWGGKTPSQGFDCSGFVSHVYKNAINKNIPDGSYHQFNSRNGTFVNFEELKPGDLMFFSSNGNDISHVGIYVGDRNFIHAPRTGRRISIDRIDRYWTTRFVKGKTYLS